MDQCFSLTNQCFSLTNQCPSLTNQYKSVTDQCFSLCDQCFSVTNQCLSLTDQCFSVTDFVREVYKYRHFRAESPKDVEILLMISSGYPGFCAFIACLSPLILGSERILKIVCKISSPMSLYYGVSRFFSKTPFVNEEAVGSDSGLAGTGAGGQMVGRNLGQAMRRLLADVGAAFPQGNG